MVPSLCPSSHSRLRSHSWMMQDTRRHCPHEIDCDIESGLRVKSELRIHTTPVIPRAIVINQNRPYGFPRAPCAAVHNVAPITMREVVTTRPALRPILSHSIPTNICPMISPTSRAFDTRVEMAAVYSVGYNFLKTTSNIPSTHAWKKEETFGQRWSLS